MDISKLIDKLGRSLDEANDYLQQLEGEYEIEQEFNDETVSDLNDRIDSLTEDIETQAEKIAELENKLADSMKERFELLGLIAYLKNELGI
jgi:hypothetical protein